MANAMPHREDQAKEAQQLADASRRVGLRCLATTTLRVAEKVVTATLDSTTELTLRESVKDIKSLRNDEDLAAAIDNDLTSSEEAVTELLAEAVASGATAELAFQKTQIEGLKVSISVADESLMVSYPIHGHTSQEMAAYMHRQFKYELDGVLASPLIGDSPTSSLPQLLGASVQKFADRIAQAVQEAYYAGVQLGLRMTAQAVTDAG